MSTKFRRKENETQQQQQQVTRTALCLGRESWSFNDNVGAAIVHRRLRLDLLEALLDELAEDGADRLAESNVTDQTVTKEAVLTGTSAIDELVCKHDMLRSSVRLEGAASAEGEAKGRDVSAFNTKM